jgi:hypothetical protein
VGDFVHRRTDGRDRGRSYRRSPNRPRPSCPASGLRELGRTQNECRAGPGAEPRHPGGDRRGDRAREAGESKVIPFNLCGHGHCDMQAYHAFLAGRLPEIEFEKRRWPTA